MTAAWWPGFIAVVYSRLNSLLIYWFLLTLPAHVDINTFIHRPSLLYLPADLFGDRDRTYRSKTSQASWVSCGSKVDGWEQAWVRGTSALAHLWGGCIIERLLGFNSEAGFGPFAHRDDKVIPQKL
jgi:hypothetical protein